MGNSQRKSQTGCKFTDLPQGVIVDIISYVDLKSLISVGSTCTAMKHLAYSAKLWRNQMVTLSPLSRENINELTAQSLIQRRLSTLRVIDNCERLQTKNKARKSRSNTHRNNKKTVCRVEATLSNQNKWIGQVTSLLLFLSGKSTIDMPIQQWSDFSHVRSLTLIYTVKHLRGVDDSISLPHQYWWAVLTQIINLEKLVFWIGVDGRSICGDSRNARELSEVELLSQVSRPMAKLADLTIGKSYWGWMCKEQIDITSKDVKNLKLLAPNLKRLSIVDGHIVLDIMKVSSQLPHLEHLGISQAHLHRYTRVDHGYITTLKSVIDSFHGLQSLEIGEIELLPLDPRVTLVPETVQALRLGSHHDKGGLASTLKLKCIIGNTANNIRVLELDLLSLFLKSGNAKDVLSNLCETIRSLHVLQILVLSRHVFYDNIELIYCIEEHVPSLFSLIGVHFYNISAVPLKIKFISRKKHTNCKNITDQVLLERSEFDPYHWTEVKKYSQKWSKAHGTAFFYPHEITGDFEMIEGAKQRHARQRDEILLDQIVKATTWERGHHVDY